MNRCQAILASILPLFAAGCATPPKSTEPILSLGARECPAEPEVFAAPALTLASSADRKLVTDIGYGAPCVLDGMRSPSLYQAVSLPLSGAPGMAVVSSMPAGQALFAPRILVLDAAGRTIREVGIEAFMFRDSALTLLLRLHTEDRFLVVASSPAVVGQPVERVQEAVQHSPVMSGHLFIQVHTGSENLSRLTLSHTGRVVIELAPLPVAHTGP